MNVILKEKKLTSTFFNLHPTVIKRIRTHMAQTNKGYTNGRWPFFFSTKS